MKPAQRQAHSLRDEANNPTQLYGMSNCEPKMCMTWRPRSEKTQAKVWGFMYSKGTDERFQASMIFILSSAIAPPRHMRCRTLVRNKNRRMRFHCAVMKPYRKLIVGASSRITNILSGSCYYGYCRNIGPYQVCVARPLQYLGFWRIQRGRRGAAVAERPS